jgi:hypothetical protein
MPHMRLCDHHEHSMGVTVGCRLVCIIKHTVLAVLAYFKTMHDAQSTLPSRV